MSRLRIDNTGKVVASSDGARAIEQTEQQVDPRVKEIVGDNEKLRMSAMNQPKHDLNSIYNILDDNEDQLDGNQKELKDLTPQGFDTPVAEDSLDKMVEFLREKKNLQQLAADAVKNNPTLVSGVRDAVLGGGMNTLDAISRTLNFTVALESGAANGLIRSLRGEGTVLDHVNSMILGSQEAIRENSGFSTTLKELGMPEGPKFKAMIPKLRMLTPSQMASDIARDVLNGTDPFELRPFGPVMSTRGAVGFGLDILLDPVTYLSFGTNTAGKLAARTATKSIFRKTFKIGEELVEDAAHGAIKIANRNLDQGAKSVVRFAGKTLLTDKELMRGIAALKANKFGHGVLEALDKFASLQIAKNVSLKNLAHDFGKAFFPDYGVHKPTMEILSGADRARVRDMNDAADIVKSTFSTFKDDEKIKFAEEMFSRNRTESVSRRLKDRSAKRIANSDAHALKAGYQNALDAYREFKNLSGADRLALLQGKLFDSPLAKLPKRTLAKFEGLKVDPSQVFGLQPFSNPKFQKAAEVLVGKEGMVTKLAKFAGLPDEILYENYIPGIIEGSLNQTIGKGKLKPSTQTLLSSGRLRREFKIKSLNPEHAYIARMAELITVGHTRRALKNVIKRFGVDEETYLAALKQGYDEFFPKDAVKQFTKSPVFDRVEELGLKSPVAKVYVPKLVMETITEMAKRQNLSGGAFLKVIDGFTQNFKAYVTSPWPAFLFRNAFSNQVLRYMNQGWSAFKLSTNGEGLKVLLDSPALKTTFIELGKGSGKKLPLSVIQKWAKADGIRGTNQFMIDTGGKLMDQLDDRAISGKLRNLFSPDMSHNDLIKIGREIGGFVEDHAKMTSYIQALKDGFSRKEAAKIVFNGLFDYGHLTSWEKNVMRRIFPFYTFSRKNLALQMKTFLTNPGRQANVFKLIKDLRDDALATLNPEQLEAYNEVKSRFTKESFAIPAGFDKDGNPLWVTGIGLPQEDLLGMFSAQGLYFRANPLAKLAGNEILRRMDADGMVGFKDQYTFREIQFLFKDVFPTPTSKEKVMEWVNDPNGFTASALRKIMGLKVVKRDVIKDGKPTGEKEFSFNADPRLLDILRNTILARHMTTLRQFGDPNVDENTQMIRFMTGISIYRQDLDRALRAQSTEIKTGAVDEYKENGLGYLYQRPGVAKDADSALKRFNKRLGDL